MMDQNRNYSKSHVYYSFFEIIISGIQNFYINPHVLVVFYPILSSRKSQSQQKLVKKITHFSILFRSKNLTHFTNLNSLDIENNMLLKHSQIPFSL